MNVRSRSREFWGELEASNVNKIPVISIDERCCSKVLKLFTLRAPAEAIGRTEATTIGEPVRSVLQGIGGLQKVQADHMARMR